MSHPEVATVLGEHFPHQQMMLDESRVEFQRDDESVAIVAVYKKDMIAQLIADPTLTDDERTSVRHQMQRATQRLERLVDGTVLFSRNPVTGFWRFEDDWQILPMPVDAPSAFQMYAPHPFRLEFKYWRSDHREVDIVRLISRRRELALLLNLRLSSPLVWQERGALPMWVSAAPPNGTPELRNPGYFYSKMEWSRPEFSDVAQLPDIRIVEDSTYYGRDESLGTPFDLPSSLHSTFDCFRTLDREAQERFLRACFWFAEGTSRTQLHESRDYVSLISAIESLLGTPYTGPACETCHMHTGDGPSALFRAFLKTYASGTSKSDRSDFYSVRSKLAHGGVLFGDRSFSWGLEPARWEHWDRFKKSQRVVQQALQTWLREAASLDARGTAVVDGVTPN